jgi:hypothetical protein
MSLPTAQLGQLPSMNFSRPQPREQIEPAWHKALTALLVSAASGATQRGISNVMEGDYTKQAVAAGLPGTTPDEKAQPWYSQIMHGPQWDRTAYQTGMKDQVLNKRLDIKDREDTRRFDQQDARLAQQLGISTAQLAELKDQHQAENDARLREQQSNDSYRQGQLGIEGRRVQNEQDRLNAEKIHWTDSRSPTDPLNASEIALRQSEVNKNTPQFQAQQRLEMMRQLGIDPTTLFGGTNTSTGQPPSQPSSNNDSVDFHGAGTQSVPGGQTDSSADRINRLLSQPQMSAYPSSSPNPTQNLSPIDALNARERANTAAGTSSQMGQSQQMGPTSYNDIPQPPITQEQPLEQAVGETGFPSDALALTRPAQTPNSPTGILPSSAANFMPAFNFDPQTLKQAAMLAKLLGMPQGTGGMPGAGGSGGMPTGYG